jgi:excinuclease Cho
MSWPTWPSIGTIDGCEPGPDHHAHLRRCVSELPTCPGVYLFHGEGELPLYIGKSINIRSRVLSHLRNPDETRLLRQTRTISHMTTAGEIGALLLEAQLIKTRQPLLNQRLRQNRQLCAFQLSHQTPTLVSTKDLNFATQPDLFGLYRSRRSALEAMNQLADEHGLCLGVLGLERLAPGRPCFRSMVNKCAGACTGKQSLQAHADTLLKAMSQMRLSCWPYPGAVALVEQAAHQVDYLVIRNWCYLGSAPDLDAASKLDQVAAGFDADGYKILCAPVFSASTQIIPLPA